MSEHTEDRPSRGRPATHNDTRARLARGAMVVGSAVAIGALGVHVLFGPGRGPLASFGPIVGIIAALACGSTVDAMIAAAVGALAGTLLAQAVYPRAWPVSSGWVATMLLTALVAALIGGVVAVVLGSSPRLTRIFSGLALTLLLATSMLGGLSAAVQPQSAEWVTGQPGSVLPLTQALMTTAKQTKTSPDDTIYLIVVQKLAQGSGYYEAMAAALAEDNRVHTDGGVPLDQPTSYRLPTLFWLLSRLPQNGGSIPVAALFLSALATISAYVLARRFVAVPLALAGAAGVAAYGSALSATPAILYVELWAGLLGLIAVALFARSRDSAHVSAGLQIAAVAVALVAALTRELAVAFLIAGLIATSVDPQLRRSRMWVAWAVGLACAALGYVLHWRAALAAFRALGAPVGVATSTSRFPWLHPDGSGFASALRLTQGVLHWNSTAMWVAALVCLAGALAVKADLGSRIMLALSGCVGLMLLTVVRAPSVAANGEAFNYWALVVIPVTLACFPLAFSRLAAARSEGAASAALITEQANASEGEGARARR